jgi:acetolactate decarboxylase
VWQRRHPRWHRGQKMRSITCGIPDSLYYALQSRVGTEKATLNHVVSTLLARSLGQSFHTLFQVSTSAALVEGLYQGAVRVSKLLEHGDFGLGTFVDLDGEMAVLDGKVYQVTASGEVSEAEGDRMIPYAIVTRFRADIEASGVQFSDFEGLTSACDRQRTSENLFYAFRLDGSFRSVQTRVMRTVAAGVSLGTAATGQANFTFKNILGTLIGLWTPGYSGAFTVPGYHFHFLSRDRKSGGHVLDCDARDLTLKTCSIAELHVSLPETSEFLQADLTRDLHRELISAERSNPQGKQAS